MSTQPPANIDSAKPEVPIFATQGGGYATYAGGQYVWHSEIPDFLGGTHVGDTVPDEWDLIPINDAARQVSNREDELFRF